MITVIGIVIAIIVVLSIKWFLWFFREKWFNWDHLKFFEKLIFRKPFQLCHNLISLPVISMVHWIKKKLGVCEHRDFISSCSSRQRQTVSSSFSSHVTIQWNAYKSSVLSSTYKSRRSSGHSWVLRTWRMNIFWSMGAQRNCDLSRDQNSLNICN